jgi:hypothetical protein
LGVDGDTKRGWEAERNEVVWEPLSGQLTEGNNMYAKTGMGLLAAAGVAVGVVGMTMGGASGAATCRPSSGINAHANTHRSADSDRSSANVGANDSSANGAGSDSGTGAEGTGDGATAATDPGTTIIAGVTVPDGVTDPSGGTDPSGDSSNGDSSNGSRPLLDLRENTNDSSAAGVDVPDTGNSVVVRSEDVTGLHIFGSVDGR